MSRTFQLIAKLSLHPVTAAIWLNKWDGKSDYSVQIERRYRDDNGTWRSTKTLDAVDLPLVAQIKEMAKAKSKNSQPTNTSRNELRIKCRFTPAGALASAGGFTAVKVEE